MYTSENKKQTKVLNGIKTIVVRNFYRNYCHDIFRKIIWTWVFPAKNIILYMHDTDLIFAFTTLSHPS